MAFRCRSMFKLSDGETIVGALGFDPHFMDVPLANEDADEPEPPYAVAITKLGLSLRFSLRAHREPSTKNGRKFTRPKPGDEVVYVGLITDDDAVACATRSGRALLCEAEDISLLSGAGRGVMLIKLQKGDELIGARVLVYTDDALIVKRDGGSEYKITLGKYEVVSRGGKGFQLFKRGKLEKEVYQEPEIPIFPEDEEDEA